MSIKFSTVFYPHIVKEYTSTEQLIAENGYEEFYAAANEIQARYLDITDPSVYQEAISEDGFEAICTVYFEDDAVYEAYHADMSVIVTGIKQPIYREHHPDMDDEIHLF
ncbi:hypothetical protein N8344_00185 [bacterium]|nr:hypothetical protein [bacterium]